MRCLIVEDDYISRTLLKELLSPFFECDIAVNGEEAVTAFTMSHESKKTYDLICLDIMMPVLDGQAALRKIRGIEKEMKIPPELEVKIIMTTALGDPKTVFSTYYECGATSYLVKPISRAKLLRELRTFGLIA